MLEKVKILEPVTLEELRKLVDMSISEFSIKVGIPEATYRRYEKEPKKMDAGKLIDIADMFEIPIGMIKL